VKNWSNVLERHGEKFPPIVEAIAMVPTPVISSPRLGALMRTTSGFEQCDHIWLLLLDDTEKKWKTTFATSQNIVAEDS
jgi:hypothetical protein